MVVTFLNNLCLQIRNTSRQLFRPRHNCTLNQAFRCTLINIKVKSSSQRTRVENGGLFSRGKYQSRDYPDCDFRHICPLRTGSKMPLRTKLKKFRQSAYIQRKLMADMIFFLNPSCEFTNNKSNNFRSGISRSLTRQQVSSKGISVFFLESHITESKVREVELGCRRDDI